MCAYLLEHLPLIAGVLALLQLYEPKSTALPITATLVNNLKSMVTIKVSTTTAPATAT